MKKHLHTALANSTDICEEDGVYAPVGHLEHRVPLKKGEKFPPFKGNQVQWVRVF